MGCKRRYKEGILMEKKKKKSKRFIKSYELIIDHPKAIVLIDNPDG